MSKTVFYMVATLILLVVAGWLFLGGSNNETTTDASNSAAVDNGDYQKVVLSIKNGNYYPNAVTVDSGKPVRIYLDKTVGGCYRSFTVRSFGISQYLKTPNDYVEFTPTKPGTYAFSCSMNMGRGTLVVK